MSERPRLRRGLEAFPVEHEGRQAVALRDPAGYSSSVLLLPRPLLEVVAMLDGENAAVDIQAEVMRRHGELLRSEELERIVATLDEHGFLDSAAFAARRAAIEGEFLARASRAATHAGGAYAGAGPELRAAMDAFFTAPDGPGPIGDDGDGPPVRGLIAPHIDYHRGGPAYAWAYRALAERGDADTFVIFGTCHGGMADPFALTRKDFETPLGPAPVDRELVAAIAERAGQDCFASELAHRGEHSIEFQAVFLRYLLGERRDFAIVPVLASFAHEALARGRGPEDDPRVPRFLEAVGESVAALGRRVAFIAGADLAHVGPRFGDPEPLSADDLARVGREDSAMLETVAAGDAGAFFASIAGDGDRRRICGFSPIYALLRVLGGQPGDVRRYGQWPDPAAVVTYASVVF